MPAFSDAVGEAVRRGQIVQIYPEGVLRFYYPGIRRFKNGAFAYAYDNNVPLLPSVITYAQPTGLHRLFKRKPCLRLTVLPPVYPDVSRPKRDEIARLRRFGTRQDDGVLPEQQPGSGGYPLNRCGLGRRRTRMYYVKPLGK